MKANKFLILLSVFGVAHADTITVTKEIIREDQHYVTRITHERDDGTITERVVEGEILPNGSIKRIAFDKNTGLPYYYYIKPSIFSGSSYLQSVKDISNGN